jgi:hypothetical protein
VWWIVFTAADLYIGLIVLETLAPSLPPEKLARLKVAKKVVIGLLVLTAVWFVVALGRRYR